MKAAGMFALAPLASGRAAAQDPLPSWCDGYTRHALLTFVEQAGDPGSPGFIPPDERLAVFDNDGTLWAEQPLYVQFQFALDRLRELAPEHPEWSEREPFRAALAGDRAALARAGQHGLLELLAATHAGMTTDEFTAIVQRWISKARHPVLQRPYTELVYQPMLELLALLQRHGFAVYIVSGGGIDFMRPWSGRVYGIAPERVIGSSIRTRFELREGRPVLLRLPELDFVDDKAGKPAAVQRFTGRRPVLAFGNSEGDRELLQWTAAGPGPRLVGLLHHTDAEREWAYDRGSAVGALDATLPLAREQGWLVVDMARDWSTVFPPREQHQARTPAPRAAPSVHTAEPPQRSGAQRGP